MNRRRIKIIILAMLCLCVVPAYLAFAGGSILSPGSSQVNAGEAYTFRLNLEPIKEASVISEEETLPYTVSVTISPDAESISVKPEVSVSQMNSKLSFSSADLESVNSLEISVYTPKSLMQETEYSITASVSGVDVPSETISFKAVPAKQDDPQKKQGSGGSSSGGGGSASVDSSLVYAGSWDNYLEELSVDGYEFTNAFNKTRTTYFVSVPEGVESLDVSATASDSSASIRITGDDNVAENNSKIMINVTADNGEVRTYRIFVTHTTEEQ